MNRPKARARRPRRSRLAALFSPIKPIRNVALLRALIALIATPCLVFAWVTVRTARDSRMQYVLDRNLAAARLAARLLDEQCKTALSVLRFMANRYDLQASLDARDRPTIESDIRSMTSQGVEPDLIYAAVYAPNGTLFARYPTNVSAQPNARKAPWFKETSAGKPIFISDVVRLPDKAHTEAIALAIPLGNVKHPRGYLLAYYRLGAIQTWFKLLGATDGVALQMATFTGRVIGPSGPLPIDKQLDPSDPVLTQIRQGAKQHVGSATGRAGKQGEIWTSYAVAETPHWLVMVNQPAMTGLAASNFLILRFALLYVPVLLVVWLAVRKLANIYHTQEEMAAQLADQNKRLLTSDRTKSEFLANVSHDLWTPLAGLQLSITGLLDRKIQWKEEQVLECLQLASDEVDQLTARVRNLLEMARLESNTEYAQKEPCDLADIVGSALERLRPLLRDRQVDAIFPAGPLMIECRHAQFEMVVMNLVENALKYSPPKSPIVIRGEMRGEDIYFSLRDYGPGVKNDDTDKIFEKFYRAPSFRHLGGSGLGLAICKTVVESHGGLIGVMNARGGGAEFWFSVPALEPIRSYRQWRTQPIS